MRILRRFTKTTLLVSLFVWLTACGGGGAGSSPSTEADSNCVIGSSTIGDCKI
jgi:hypothetical protein